MVVTLESGKVLKKANKGKKIEIKIEKGIESTTMLNNKKDRAR